MRRRFMSVKGFNEIFDINNYLTVEVIEDGLTVSFENAIEYGIDGKGWRKLQKGANSPKLKIGQTISFKGNLTPKGFVGIGTFTISKRCNLKGNCMSMLFGDDAVNNLSLSGKDYAFYKLFYNCTNIVSVSENFLPATTLAYSCYSDMFYGCSNLTTAPALPATKIATDCYYNMFNGCKSLITTPVLPATTLVYDCYDRMFSNCTKLTTAPELPATALAPYCYHSMFYGCTNLTNAPALPATALANSCYNSMFRDCSKLNYIKMLATDISASSCLYSWVDGVASTGTFVKNPNMTSLPTGVDGIPSGWTVVNDGNLITFTVNGTVYQAEEGMTFYDWALSEYYDSSCLLNLGITGNTSLRDDIINGNISSDDSITIVYGGGATITPGIYTNTIIQPISYIANVGGWD